MNRVWQLFVLVVIGMVAASQAQDAPETPAAPPQSDAPAVTTVQDNSALASEIEQLRSEVDQLKLQVANLSSRVEQLQGAGKPAEQSSVKHATPAKNSAASKKKTGVSASSAPAPSIVPGDDRAAPVTVLVFHDGHRTEARNYAIVGQTLWIYTDQDSKKVPLADLDVAATKEANADRGISFQIPPTR